MSASPPLIVVAGATATGKTALAIELARALDGEIVGADSRQVYRGMAIGTAQPSAAELAAIPHHLVAVVSPATPFGLATYLTLAHAAIADIRGRGRLPILVGGTGQYIWALLDGWTVPRVAPDWKLRARLEQEGIEHGPDALHARLAVVDPEAAWAIHPHNLRRVIRALEVFELTGAPISAQQQKSGGEAARILGLSIERDHHYRQIDGRVEAMYAGGLLDELRELERCGFGADLPSMAAIGYPEGWAVLAGRMTREQAITATKTATHRLARQQSTWFRVSDERIHWLHADAMDVVRQALTVVEKARLV